MDRLKADYSWCKHSKVLKITLIITLKSRWKKSWKCNEPKSAQVLLNRGPLFLLKKTSFFILLLLFQAWHASKRLSSFNHFISFYGKIKISKKFGKREKLFGVCLVDKTKQSSQWFILFKVLSVRKCELKRFFTKSILKVSLKSQNQVVLSRNKLICVIKAMILKIHKYKFPVSFSLKILSNRSDLNETVKL